MWNGKRLFEINAKQMKPDGRWDNMHWSNHGDFITMQGDGKRDEAYAFQISTNRGTRLTWEGRTKYPDLFIAKNTGWVNVGTAKDTAEFAVQSIRRWWEDVGRRDYPGATQLVITADGGGSNGSRVRLWKTQLQEFCNEIGIPVAVSHFPPGTSKWNKIEHRLFSFISMNWRGRPLTCLETVVKLISSTTTGAGLKVKAELDRNEYAKGIKITDAQMRMLDISRAEFHGEWNYTIQPQHTLDL